ncbi:hypothetical protein [Capybara microvirus Cap1_SP_159]|nr:hypothetical protein [Capybara microvirus Cap1_SP_159]
MVDQSHEVLTRLDTILSRYAGNLAELVAWRGSVAYGEQSTLDLQSAYDKMREAHEAFVDLPNNPFKSFDEAMLAVSDGTFVEKIAKSSEASQPPPNAEVKNEEK